MNDQLTNNRQLTGWRLVAGRAIWVVLAAFVMVLYGYALLLWDMGYQDVGFQVLMPVGFLIIGFVIFARKSDDAMGLLTSLMLLYLGPYLISGANNIVGEQPGLALLNGLAQAIGTSCFFLFIFLFPDGRFIPSWMRWVAFPAIALIFVGFLSASWSVLSTAVFLIASIVGFISQGYRYRFVASAVERQQTKWVLVGLTGILLILLWWFLILEPELLYALPEDPFLYFLHQIPAVTLSLTLPLGIAFSILRYRLWQIDALINRALVYGALTAMLALVYFAGVILIQQLVGALTGQAGESGLAIVLSTLMIAALFQPLRRRLQEIIDRRFYRRKYNAEQTLAAFAAVTRDEVDLTALSDRLLGVIEETMQPAQAAIWLRPPAENSRQQAAGGRQQ